MRDQAVLTLAVDGAAVMKETAAAMAAPAAAAADEGELDYLAGLEHSDERAEHGLANSTETDVAGALAVVAKRLAGAHCWRQRYTGHLFAVHMALGHVFWDCDFWHSWPGLALAMTRGVRHPTMGFAW